MADLDNGGNVSFTTKEMLVRMDGKLDAVLYKQAGYDVELALLKARANEVEHRMVNREAERTARQDQLDNGLSEARTLMAREIANIKESQSKLARKLAYATGTVSGVIVAAEIVSRLWPK